jgi:hypothetical protein
MFVCGFLIEPKKTCFVKNVCICGAGLKKLVRVLNRHQDNKNGKGLCLRLSAKSSGVIFLNINAGESLMMLPRKFPESDLPWHFNIQVTGRC